MNSKASPSRLIWPALKWPPITSVGVSAKRENSSCRVTADCLRSESAVDDQSRWAIWQGWWATSPVSRASWPSEAMWMLIWPGLWPGVGIRVTSSASLASEATRSARPASAIGFTESLNTASLSASSWLWSRQYSYSVLPNTYLAFGKVGTHLPSTSRVFQPTWSTCRWVQRTVSMLSGAKPAVVRVSRNGSLRSFQVGTLRPCLSLPRPVSTMIRRDGVSTSSEWIDIFSRPSSVAKCGISQGSFCISSLVASGRMKRVLPTVSSSTILVILTLPTFQCIRRLPVLFRRSCCGSTRAVDDDGAELVAFFHRQMRLRGVRQRKLTGDVVKTRAGREPFGDVGLSCRQQWRRQREQHQRAQGDAFFHQVAHRDERRAIAVGGVDRDGRIHRHQLQGDLDVAAEIDIDHAVDAALPGKGQRLRDNVLVAIVDDKIGAGEPCLLGLHFRADGRDHLGATPFGELHGIMADSAGAAGDEHGLSRDRSVAIEAAPRRHAGNPERGA